MNVCILMGSKLFHYFLLTVNQANSCMHAGLHSYPRGDDAGSEDTHMPLSFINLRVGRVSATPLWALCVLISLSFTEVWSQFPGSSPAVKAYEKT